MEIIMIINIQCFTDLMQPDITVLNVEKKLFEILELMVPFENNITSKHKYKSDHYENFTSGFLHITQLSLLLRKKQKDF